MQSALTAEIEIDHHGPVAVVRFNRPGTLNAFTRTMGDAYAVAMRQLDRDPRVRAIVVTGSGRGFCSGADVEVLRGGPAAIRAFIPVQEDMPSFVHRLSTPVIAAVNGPVAGIGFAYMMGSDVRFAAREAKIATTFARLGLVAEYGLSWLLPRALGVGRALDLLLSGRVITGAEALEMGLVQFAVPVADVFTAAVEYATDLALNCAPTSLAVIKAQVYADLEDNETRALERTARLMDRSFDGPDLAEALSARSESRRPLFGAAAGYVIAPDARSAASPVSS
ncbi:enoyl-CoA hydratase-related protein [Frankia sp. CiP1_Cm_nod1]|uniref:enoyl-CoA hydratase-related protein n=1 Tax=Frankia sp. CiP1_Cm_nod1 TaxID=2897160 RepID=UPI00202579FE